MCLLGLFTLLLALALPARAQDVYADRAGGQSFDSYALPSALENNLEKLNKVISIKVSNAPLEQALRQITEAANLKLMYGGHAVASENTVTLALDRVTVLEALHEAVRDTGLSFKITYNGQLLVVKRPATVEKGPHLLREAQVVQTGTITGRVIDAGTGEGLPGVNVVIEGSIQGAATDTEGTYIIPEVEPGTYALQASFIGYKPQTVEDVPVVADEVTEVNFTLEEDVAGLEEVVVVGYGQQQRRKITGSVASVNIEDIAEIPVQGIDEALIGQIPGVQVQQMSGAPGGGINIKVRGIGSLSAGTQPLYVVDGFPIGTNEDLAVNTNPLSTLNPDDIASIQVLKDASATAIYGSRGANGVVLITTKQGKAGEPRFEFESYMGTQSIFREIDMVNGWQLAEMKIERINNEWIDQDPVNNKRSDPNEVRPSRYQISDYDRYIYENRVEGTDWQDALYQDAPMQNYSLTASGGSGDARYYVSGAYFDQGGIIPNSSYTRYSVRANLDAKLSDRLMVGLNFSPSYTENKLTQTDGHPSSGQVIRILGMDPMLPAYNDDGSYATRVDLGEGFGTREYDNPMFTISEVTDRQTRLRALGTMFADLKITEDLVFRAQFGADAGESRDKFYRPSYTQIHGAVAEGTNGSSFSLNWLSENTLTYDKNIGLDHSFTGLLGFTLQKDYYESNWLQAKNFPNDLVRTLNAGQVTDGRSLEREWAMLSYFTRVNYSFRDRYLLTATLRRDGSSRFGPNNRWGTFPSASIGWFVSEEPFMRGISFLNSLKLRASYGLTGNNSIPNYGHVSLLNNEGYILGSSENLLPGLYPATSPNPDLTWEVAKQADIGLDMGLFGNRVYVTADYYNKLTTDLLLEVPLPAITGYQDALQNIGKIRNEGVEFAVSTKNLVGALEWTTDFNISFNRNKVLALGPGGEPIRYRTWFGWTHITEVGEPLGNFYGWKKEGVYQDWEDIEKYPIYAPGTSQASTPGSERFADIDGDGVITENDRTVIGNAQPDYIFGITNRFRFKNFDLMVLVDGVQGRDVINQVRRYVGHYRASPQFQEVYDGRWRSLEEPGDGWIPRLNWFNGQSSSFSSGYVEDGSFVRVRNIVLGYTLPRGLFGTVRRARVYTAVKNAFMFTDYSGYNPDINERGASPTAMGVDHGGYPLQRVYTIGVSVGF